MNRQPPVLSPEPPEELRVVMRLSNRDRDLKLWVWQNRADAGAVLRQALRAELTRRGDLPSLSTKGAPGKSTPAAAPPSPVLATEAQSPAAIALTNPLYDSNPLNGLDPAQLERLLAAAATMLAQDSGSLPSANEPPAGANGTPKGLSTEVPVSTGERSTPKPGRHALSPDKRALLDGMTGAHG